MNETHKRRAYSNMGECGARPVDGDIQLVDEWHLVSCTGCHDMRNEADERDAERRWNHLSAISNLHRRRKAR